MFCNMIYMDLKKINRQYTSQGFAGFWKIKSHIRNRTNRYDFY